jgi:long-subunit acyl-CoA synthetase (AMP-forming)
MAQAQTVAQHAPWHYTTDVQQFAPHRCMHVPRVWTRLKKITSRHAFWFGTTITVDETDRVC